jgi:hypothetical protein
MEMIMSEYVDLAKQSLKHPSDFGWFGFEEMFVTWGFAGINKDARDNIADISNWHCTIEEMKRLFPDTYDECFYEVGLKHWLVGHADQLCVKVLKSEIPHSLITDEDITDEFKAVVDIATYLAYEYPILDDSDYSERQWAATNADIEDMANCSWVPFGQKCIVEDGFGETIQSWLLNNDCYEAGHHDDGTPYFDEKDMIEAIYDCWLDNREDEDSNIFWSEWEEANISAKSRRINRRNEENGQLTLELA